jgi:hypothetical protein
MLVGIGKELETRQNKLVAFAAKVGRDYSPGGFMLVGRALNGGDPAWLPADMNDSDQRMKILAELRSSTFDNEWTEWLRKDHKRAFFRVGEKVFNKLFVHNENRFWADQSVWSNLYKVTYSETGNPPKWLRDTQVPFVNKLLEMEHACFRPTYMLILAGEWWYRYHFDELGVERHKVADLHVEAAQWGETKVVLAEHPQCKKEDKFVDQVFAGFELLRKQ